VGLAEPRVAAARATSLAAGRGVVGQVDRELLVEVGQLASVLVFTLSKLMALEFPAF